MLGGTEGLYWGVLRGYVGGYGEAMQGGGGY